MEIKIKNNGLSLVELLLLLLIAGLLAVVSMPNFKSLLNQKRVSFIVQQMQMSLMLARSNAITKHLTVAICGSTNGKSCSTLNDWNQGWLIYQDNNDDGVFNTTDTLIKVNRLTDWNINILWNNRSFIAFYQNGKVKNVGTFTIFKNNFIKKIIISLTGRVRVDDVSS